MNNSNYQIYFDCGFSRLRAGAFNKIDPSEAFYGESKFLLDHFMLESEIQKIITFLEKKTGEYINDINLMIDSPKMLSIGISISKQNDGLKLRQEDIQFLVQEAKQQILKYYNNKNIIHIIINNYKINNIDYDYLPEDIKCNFISLDIIFICLPGEIIEYFKNFFYRSSISINKVVCSSYVKSIYYKDTLSFVGDVSFIDIGFNKTSIVSFAKNKIVSLNTLEIGGNHITKDISKVLKIDLDQAENIKLNFEKKKDFSNNNFFSPALVKKVIFARIEEILELSINLIKLNLILPNQFKIFLMGDSSKILDNHYKDKIYSTNDLDFVAETTKDICLSGFKFGTGSNKQEFVVIPKRHIKQGFFEKFFHFFDK